mgnify:CR=1 FL=1|jgi:hypothetical protein
MKPLRKHNTIQEMSPQDKHKALKGEQNQANYLIEAKERNSEHKTRFLRQQT